MEPSQINPTPELQRDSREESVIRPVLRCLSVLIILAATVGALIVVSPLFAPGYLMNFTHSQRQGMLECYLSGPVWSLPSAWCSFLQAGMAPFQSNPILFNHIVLLLHLAFPLEVAYKVSLLVVWFLLPSVVGIILYSRKRYLLAAFSFSFLLFDHGVQDVTGPEFFLFVESDMGQVLGFALLAATIVTALLFFKNPTRRGLALLSLISALYFLAHPTTSLFLGPILIILAMLHRKEVLTSRKLFISYPLIVFLIVGYFLMPVLFNLQSNEPGAANLGVTSPWHMVQEKIGKSLNPLILIFGIAGLIILGCERGSKIWAIPALAGGVLLAWIFHTVLSWIHLFDFAQFPRIIGIMYILLLIGAGASIEWSVLLFSARKNSLGLAGAAIILILFGFIAGTQFATLHHRAKDLTTSSNPLYEPLFSVLSRLNNSQGRILVEETYGQTTYPVNLSSVWGIGPLATTSDLAGPMLRFYKNPYAGTKDFQIQNKRIETLSMDEYLDLLETWNIAYIVAGSGPYRKAFRFLPVAFTSGPFIVYNNTLTPVTYFRVGNGVINQTDYRKTSARAVITAFDFTNVIFKVRYWNNWKATLDGNPLPIQRSMRDLMLVTIPQGTHTIEFTYAMRWWDYFGWILTLLGLSIVMVLFCKPQTKNKNS